MEEAGLDVDRLKRRQTKQENARIHPSSPQQLISCDPFVKPFSNKVAQKIAVVNMK